MSYPTMQPATLERTRVEMAKVVPVDRAYVKVVFGREHWFRFFTPGTWQEVDAAVASEKVMRANPGSRRAVSVRCTGLFDGVPVIGEAVAKRKRRVR